MCIRDSLVTLGHGPQNVPFHIVWHMPAIKCAAVFKVKIKAAVVHVGAAYNGQLVIAKVHFGMKMCIRDSF